MRELTEPLPAAMICGLLFSSRVTLRDTVVRLEERFGPVDITSPEYKFIHTDYYEAEMGPDLRRVFLVFSLHVSQDCLVYAKLECRKIERDFMKAGHRSINIDPGLLTPERLVLATGKNFTHRIYLGRGVFAEVTLIASRSGFRTLEWTFPDYASPEILEFWNMTRKKYLAALKNKGLV